MRRFQRAVTEQPGKHGPLDIKVKLGALAPTHAETLFMLGAKMVSEDRYNQPWQYGREILRYWVELMMDAKSLDEVEAIANLCAEDPQSAEARRAIRARALTQITISQPELEAQPAQQALTLDVR